MRTATIILAAAAAVSAAPQLGGLGSLTNLTSGLSGAMGGVKERSAASSAPCSLAICNRATPEVVNKFIESDIKKRQSLPVGGTSEATDLTSEVTGALSGVGLRTKRGSESDPTTEVEKEAEKAEEEAQALADRGMLPKVPSLPVSTTDIKRSATKPLRLASRQSVPSIGSTSDEVAAAEQELENAMQTRNLFKRGRLSKRGITSAADIEKQIADATKKRNTLRQGMPVPGKTVNKRLGTGDLQSIDPSEVDSEVQGMVPSADATKGEVENTLPIGKRLITERAC